MASAGKHLLSAGDGNDTDYVADESGSSKSCSKLVPRSKVAAIGLAVGMGAVIGGIAGLILGLSSTPAAPPPAFHQRPVVVNTWWGDVTNVTWHWVNASYPAMDAVEAGCSYAEEAQKDTTVGYGGSPDANGEVTLDALIMDGSAMDVGAVGYLRDVKSAITTARRVLTYTRHTMLAGDGARDFAVMTGLNTSSLETPVSNGMMDTFYASNCTPNYYANLVNNRTGAPVNESCGPYTTLPTPLPTPYPAAAAAAAQAAGWQAGHSGSSAAQPWTMRPGAPAPAPRMPGRPTTRRSRTDHDTIGLCALDAAGNIALGMSSNGARYKVPGRVGDAPLIGAGGYAASDAGCAAATGDGDITARFLPAFTAVESMRRGMNPTDACVDAVQRIAAYYPVFELGLVCMDKAGQYGAASHGWNFTYCYAAPDTQGQPECKVIPPMDAPW